LLRRRLLNHHLSFFYDPIAVYGSDVCPEVAQRGHIFNQCKELIGFNLKFFVLVEKNFFNNIHYLLLECMQFTKRILKEGTYGFVDNFLAISNMVCVILYHTKGAYKILMCWTEKISFIFWMIGAINLRDRHQLVLNMVDYLEL
jgi:hypothetical protein